MVAVEIIVVGVVVYVAVILTFDSNVIILSWFGN